MTKTLRESERENERNERDEKIYRAASVLDNREIADPVAGIIIQSTGSSLKTLSVPLIQSPDIG